MNRNMLANFDCHIDLFEQFFGEKLQDRQNVDPNILLVIYLRSRRFINQAYEVMLRTVQCGK
jgi:hypothetical protein